MAKQEEHYYFSALSERHDELIGRLNRFEDRVLSRLDRLNGSVESNTRFRYRSGAYMTIVASGIAAVFSLIIAPLVLHYLI